MRVADAREAQTGYYSPNYAVSYRGYTIKRVSHFEGYLIDGHKVNDGYVVCDARACTNLMPGATWFQTVQDAKDGIDDLIATNEEQHRPGDLGDKQTHDYPFFASEPFWARVRVRKAAQRNAVTMASLLAAVRRGDDVSAQIDTILAEIDDSADTRATVHDVARATKTRVGPKGLTGLDYLPIVSRAMEERG